LNCRSWSLSSQLLSSTAVRLPHFPSPTGLSFKSGISSRVFASNIMLGFHLSFLRTQKGSGKGGREGKGSCWDPSGLSNSASCGTRGRAQTIISATLKTSAIPEQPWTNLTPIRKSQLLVSTRTWTPLTETVIIANSYLCGNMGQFYIIAPGYWQSLASK